MAEGKKSYSEKLRDPRWQKKRLEILSRDEWKCKLCGDEKNTLHVHHNEYEGEPWDAPSDSLETLCEHCHFAVEAVKDLEGAKLLKIGKFYFDGKVSYMIAKTARNNIAVFSNCDEHKGLIAAFDRGDLDNILKSFDNG